MSKDSDKYVKTQRVILDPDHQGRLITTLQRYREYFFRYTFHQIRLLPDSVHITYYQQFYKIGYIESKLVNSCDITYDELLFIEGLEEMLSRNQFNFH